MLVLVYDIVIEAIVDLDITCRVHSISVSCVYVGGVIGLCVIASKMICV